MGAVLLPAVKDALGGTRFRASKDMQKQCPSISGAEAFETVYEVDSRDRLKRRARRRRPTSRRRMLFR